MNHVVCIAGIELIYVMVTYVARNGVGSDVGGGAKMYIQTSWFMAPRLESIMAHVYPCVRYDDRVSMITDDRFGGDYRD
ncbi:hypothetical protein BJX63DRAFT_386207, partial [Aspergillus granulosus]